MKSSYLQDDVILLLKDITGMIEPLETEKREEKIQSGIHYSEMLPLEYKPTKEYMDLYYEALQIHGETTACAVKNISEKIWQRKKGQVVLVSLARAGTPIGILIKRYLKYRYGVDVMHYTISIIRGRGIDRNAIEYILQNHTPESIQFVDGWIGKGAIIGELKKEIKMYPKIDDELAVLADPTCLTTLYGTSQDFLIPSACLNATVSGLFSRTVLNDTLIGSKDFHGAVYYPNLEKEDLSYHFIQEIEKYFTKEMTELSEEETQKNAMEEVKNIAEDFDISNINYIKPGIGETTRVLLRRVPWKILVRDKNDEKNIGHIKRLCLEKGVELVEYPLKGYRACGIIKNLSDV